MQHPRIVHGVSKAEYWFEERCHITEWLNSPEDERVSVARARVDPGVTTRWHRLAGIVERYLIQEGHGLVEVGDLPVTEVGPGDLVIIPAGVAQRITNPGKSSLVFLAICTPRFRPDAYEDLADLTA